MVGWGGVGLEWPLLGLCVECLSKSSIEDLDLGMAEDLETDLIDVQIHVHINVCLRMVLYTYTQIIYYRTCELEQTLSSSSDTAVQEVVSFRIFSASLVSMTWAAMSLKFSHHSCGPIFSACIWA